MVALLFQLLLVALLGLLLVRLRLLLVALQQKRLLALSTELLVKLRLLLALLQRLLLFALSTELLVALRLQVTLLQRLLLPALSAGATVLEAALGASALVAKPVTARRRGSALGILPSTLRYGGRLHAACTRVVGKAASRAPLARPTRPVATGMALGGWLRLLLFELLLPRWLEDSTR